MQRARGKYDVLFIDTDRTVGFNLADGDAGRPSVVPFEMSPGRADQVVTNADVPRRIENLDAGMGFSRRIEGVPNGYGYCLPGYTRAPGTIFMPAGKVTPIALPPPPPTTPYGAITQSERFDGHIFLMGGARAMVLSADGSSATIDRSFTDSFQSCGSAVFNNKLYVSGTGGGFANRAVGGAWTYDTSLSRHSLASVSWRPLGIPTQMLLSMSPGNSQTDLIWCPITADPMNPGAWSAPVSIGNERRQGVARIVAAPRHAYMYSPDGIYDMDELGVRSFNIAPWVGEAEDTTNGLWGMPTTRGVYYSHSQGLAYVDTASGETQYQPEWAQPGWGLPWEGPISGQPFAGTFANGWGMMGFYSPPRGVTTPGAPPPGPSTDYQTYIMAGRRDPGGSAGNLAYGQASHVWHGAEAVIPGIVMHMKVHTIDAGFEGGWPRLLMAGGWFASWQSLPKVGSPLQELIWGGQFQPADLSSLFLPADPWGQPSAVKQLLQIDLIADRLQLGSDYLKVLASVDGAAFVDQGTAEADVYTSLAPSPVLEGRYLSTRIDNFGSAVLRSIELRAALGLQLREARTYRLVLAWDNALKSARSRETADPDLRMLDLQYLLGRVVLLDDGTAGAPYRVRVLQVATGERRRLGGPERASANGTEGAWAMVVPVTVSFLDYPFRWSGPPTDVFDRDRVWA